MRCTPFCKISGNVIVSADPPLLTGGYILHKGVKKLENQPVLLAENNNIFLIDWLTFTAFGISVFQAKQMLGLTSPDIVWLDQQKFGNGYPMHSYWNGITISYGADDEKFYSDPMKVRTDMGICVNLSGKGCRAFESYGHGDWKVLLAKLFTLNDTCQREKKGRIFSYNITRLDLAYDDHIGLLDIYRIEQDIRCRYYLSKSKYSEVLWSDDQKKDIHGLTCQVGSDKSDIKIRIYDKAAERGYKDRHWVRCELQLRDGRALVAASKILELDHIGQTVSGILRNYLTFRIPTADSNKSRWPIADYWEKVLLNMGAISLWEAPGEPYNFENTEHWLKKQYGPAIVVMDEIHDPGFLVAECRRMFPLSTLSPKYKQILEMYRRPPRDFDIIDDSTDMDDIFPPEQSCLDGFEED